MHNQTTQFDACYQPDATLIGSIILVIFALPVHLLLMKIFYIDCQLTLPHHKIMMSLTLSDALQIFILSAWVLCRRILGMIQNQEAACKYSQTVVLFFVTVTFLVSSWNTVTLSLERYISCIYSLHIYTILTTRRVALVISAQWIVGIGLGVTAVCLHQMTDALNISNSSMNQQLMVLVIFTSATVIASIQIRLLHFSHSKLAKTKPNSSFGTKAEMAGFRKRQMKITFVASIVAVSYIVCMFPIAVLSAYEWQHGPITNRLLKFALIAMAMLNSLLDPVIYGLGVRDTRRLMWKNIKQVKDFMLCHLCRISPENLN